MTAAPSPRPPSRSVRDVYDANYHRVLGYALRRAATREDAEDVAAETFLAAWRRLDEVSPRRGPPALALRRRAQRARQPASQRAAARTPLGPPPGGSRRRRTRHGTTADDELASLAAAFARLEDDDRELLGLAAWEELDTGEIATVLGCSRNAARIRASPAGGWHTSCSGRTRAQRAGRWSPATPSRDSEGSAVGSQLEGLVARLQPVHDEDHSVQVEVPGDRGALRAHRGRSQWRASGRSSAARPSRLIAAASAVVAGARSRSWRSTSVPRRKW